MLIRLIRWLLGYVEFEFNNGFSQGFVEDLFDLGIRAYNIKTTENGIKGECKTGDYKRLHRIALKHGGCVKITKKHGAVFPLLKLRSRFSLAVGALAFIIVFCTVSGFVWQVDIVGNERISEKQIMSFLQENGFERGVSKRSVDKDYLESLMLASFPDIAWVHINYNGSLARVEISETVPKPTVNDQKGIYNVKASRDGIIVSNTAYEGWEVAKAGDSVVKGDLLISGVHKTNENTNSAFAHARGVVMAKVEDDFSLTVSREQRYKQYTSKKTYTELYFFGIRIFLHLPLGDLPNADVSENAKYIRLNKRNLPVGIIKKSVSYYDMCSRRLSDSELNKLMSEEIEKSLADTYKNDEILSKKINISLNANNATAKGTVITLQDIAQEVKMTVKKK